MNECPGRTGEADHCWHRSDYQHAMMWHEDVFCCWCNEFKCRHLKPEPMRGHGPHAPTVGYLR